MKKYLMAVLFAFVSIMAMAVPNGFYQNSRGRGVYISGDSFSSTNRDGEVVVTWQIVSERDGVLTLRSSLGATSTATWWREDGKIYLEWNYSTYVHD